MLRTMLIACALACSISSTSCIADVITLGTEAGGTSALVNGSLRFQQIYDKSLFLAQVPSGKILVSAIRYRRTNGTNGTMIDDVNFAFTLSTTMLEVDDLKPTFVENVGSNSQAFFSGKPSLVTEMDGTFLLASGGNFLYDPTEGNLLIDVTKSSNPVSGANPLSVATVAGSSVMRFITHDNSTTAGDTYGNGLVTRFTFTAVPEPNSAVLLLTGSLLLLRRRTRTVAAH